MALKFGPYSPVVQAGDTFWVSGQVGVDPATKRARQDITAQTEQALANLEAALQQEKLERDDVVKTTVYLTDMDNFAAMNEVYERFFGAPRPARSTVGVRALPRVAGNIELLIEIEAVAYQEDA